MPILLSIFSCPCKSFCFLSTALSILFFLNVSLYIYRSNSLPLILYPSIYFSSSMKPLLSYFLLYVYIYVSLLISISILPYLFHLYFYPSFSLTLFMSIITSVYLSMNLLSFIYFDLYIKPPIFISFSMSILISSVISLCLLSYPSLFLSLPILPSPPRSISILQYVFCIFVHNRFFLSFFLQG